MHKNTQNLRGILPGMSTYCTLPLVEMPILTGFSVTSFRFLCNFYVFGTKKAGHIWSYLSPFDLISSHRDSFGIIFFVPREGEKKSGGLAPENDYFPSES